MVKNRFLVVCNQKIKSGSQLTLSQPAFKFQSISSDDLVASGSFIQVVKEVEVSS